MNAMEVSAEENIQKGRPARSAVRAFLLYYLLLIAAGMLLFLLPGTLAEGGGLPAGKALFISISAACLCGLDISHSANAFSAQGFAVLLLLIQCSAIASISFFLSFVRLSGISGWIAEKQDKGLRTFSEIWRDVLPRVCLYLFIIEALSIYTLYAFWPSGKVFTPSVRLFHALFEGVSLVCQSGFTSISSGYRHELISHTYVFLLMGAGITFFASLGYPVIYDLMSAPRLRARMLNPDRNWFLHTRVIFFSSVVIAAIAAVLFYVFESKGSDLLSHKMVESAFACLFNTCGIRNAGLNNFDFQQLATPTRIMYVLLMFIGTGPAAAGGGVGAGAPYILFSGRKGFMQIAKKVARAILWYGLITSALGWILLIAITGSSPLSALYLSVSAFGNAGSSITDITALSMPVHIVLAVLMLAGRVGLPLLGFRLLRRQIKGQDTPAAEIVLP